jgi:hypothetical protein
MPDVAVTFAPVYIYVVLLPAYGVLPVVRVDVKQIPEDGLLRPKHVVKV